MFHKMELKQKVFQSQNGAKIYICLYVGVVLHVIYDKPQYIEE